MIEVELRGPLTDARGKQLTASCAQHGILVGEYRQIAIFCDTQDERLGNFYDPKVRIALQLSCDIQTKKKSLHLKVKNGHWAQVGRQEVVLHLDPEDLSEAYQLLRTFGITKGCPSFYHRIDYQFGDITLSLKDSGLMSDHWEAEVSATTYDEASAQKRLQMFLKKLHLTPWSESAYKEVVKKVYREHPPIAFSEIDVSRVWKE